MTGAGSDVDSPSFDIFTSRRADVIDSTLTESMGSPPVRTAFSSRSSSSSSSDVDEGSPGDDPLLSLSLATLSSSSNPPPNNWVPADAAVDLRTMKYLQRDKEVQYSMKGRAENGLTVGILGVAAFLAGSLRRFASSFAAYFELYRRARIALTLGRRHHRLRNATL